MGVEPGRGAHQLVDDDQAVGLQRLAGRHVVDDAVGILGREHLGRAVGVHEGRPKAAALEPGAGQALVFGGDDERRPREPSRRTRAWPRRPRRPGSSPVSSSSTSSADELGDPVGAGEADVARAEMQHLDDVLRLQGLGLEALERQARPIAAAAEGDADAGVREQASTPCSIRPLGRARWTRPSDGFGLRTHGGWFPSMRCSAARADLARRPALGKRAADFHPVLAVLYDPTQLERCLQGLTFWYTGDRDRREAAAGAIIGLSAARSRCVTGSGAVMLLIAGSSEPTSRRSSSTGPWGCPFAGP